MVNIHYKQFTLLFQKKWSPVLSKLYKRQIAIVFYRRLEEGEEFLGNRQKIPDCPILCRAVANMTVKFLCMLLCGFLSLRCTDMSGLNWTVS